jgi:hypothetical protein
MQCAQHAELAIDGVRGGEQLSGRLAPQHVLAALRRQQIRGVGLPAGELLQLQRTTKARHGGLEPCSELVGIDTEVGPDWLRRVGARDTAHGTRI